MLVSAISLHKSVTGIHKSPLSWTSLHLQPHPNSLRSRDVSSLCHAANSHWLTILPWCWARWKAGGEGDDRGQGGWTAPTRWTWVWASSGRWRRTRKPGVCSPSGHKESDTAEHLNNSSSYLTMVMYVSLLLSQFFSFPHWAHKSVPYVCAALQYIHQYHLRKIISNICTITLSLLLV